MCGRFTLTVHQLGDVVEQLDASIDEILLDTYRPRYCSCRTLAGRNRVGVRQFDRKPEIMFVSHWGTAARG